MFKKAILGAVAILLVISFAGCSGEDQKQMEVRTVELHSGDYGSFSNGLSTYYDDFSQFIGNIEAIQTQADSVLGFTEQGKKTYYENMCMLTAMLKLKLTVLKEIDTLPVTTDYDDRAEGTLPLSGGEGYKINRVGEITFGFQGSQDGEDIIYEGKVEVSTGYLSISDERTYPNGDMCRIVTEMTMGESGLVLRQWETAINYTMKETKTVLFAAVSSIDGKETEIAYYEGTGESLSLMSFEEMYDKSISSLMYSVSAQLSIRVRGGQAIVS